MNLDPKTSLTPDELETIQIAERIAWEARDPNVTNVIEDLLCIIRCMDMELVFKNMEKPDVHA